MDGRYMGLYSLSSFGVLAVPVFMILSFLYTDVARLSEKGAYYNKRIIRLMVPHVFWAFIYWIGLLLVDYKEGTNLAYGVEGVVWQLLLGHSINQSEWFQITLLIITVLYAVFYPMMKNHKWGILVCITILCMFLQYSEWNFRFFNEIPMLGVINRDWIVFPLGRIVEMIPLSVIGIYLQQSNRLHDLKGNKTLEVVLILFLLLFYKYQIFISIEHTWGYAGFSNMVLASLLVILFYIAPFNRFPNMIKVVLKQFAKYTMAVYFMHRLVGTVLSASGTFEKMHIQDGTIAQCILIFVMSLLIARCLSCSRIEVIRKAVQ